MAPKNRAVGLMLMPVSVPAPVPVLIPPSPDVVEIMLAYWWEHGFFECCENYSLDDVNEQWRRFYRQHDA
jgi:hypothetical protein